MKILSLSGENLAGSDRPLHHRLLPVGRLAPPVCLPSLVTLAQARAPCSMPFVSPLYDEMLRFIANRKECRRSGPDDEEKLKANDVRGIPQSRPRQRFCRGGFVAAMAASGGPGLGGAPRPQPL